MIFRQIGESNGLAKRITGGKSNGKGASLGKILVIKATQAGRELPVKINYDKLIWSGLSWAAGEIDCTALAATPIEIVCTTTDTSKLKLACELYAVDYR